MSRHRRGQRESVRLERAQARERKRQRLLEAAIRVVRREGAGVSMEDIAREAGVSKPIVYRAFGDREGLTGAVADHFAEELAHVLAGSIGEAPDDRTRVGRTIDAYLSFIESEPAIVRFLIHSGLQAAGEDGVAIAGFVSRIGQMVTQAIGEAMRERGLDSSPAEVWAYAIVGAVHMAGDWWLDRRTVPRQRLVEYLTVLVWDGMGSFRAPAGATSVMS